MTELRVHTVESAPAASKPILEGAGKAMGFVPNLYGVFAEAPALLKAYTAVGQAFEGSSLSPSERQIVLLTTSFENGCEYCMAAHSTIAGMQRVPDEIVAALRAGGPLGDPKLEALRRLTESVVRERGWVAEHEVRAFLGAGYAKAQLLEVILGVGMKTLSNYTNHLAATPLDEAFEPQAWQDPVAKAG